MLGSLTLYRRLLNEHVFNSLAGGTQALADDTLEKFKPKLPAFGHALAGVGAGCTVSFIAAPIEHVKARLQIQYDPNKSRRLYTGPVDCASKLV